MPKRFWLFKSEPSCFSVEHLEAEPKKTTHWDGVRNYQARNMLRDDVKKGDGVLFYNSNTKVLGIAGICEVSKSGYADHTARDPNSEHPDPKSSKENPIWYMVDVTLKQKLAQTLPLTTLKTTSGLEEMMLLQRGSRLSIQPVSFQEWKVILKLASKL